MIWWILAIIAGIIGGTIFGFWVGWKSSNRLNDMYPTWNMRR